jgi:hypothetical protein
MQRAASVAWAFCLRLPCFTGLVFFTRSERMAGSLSNAMELVVLDGIFGGPSYTKATTLTVKLYTATPSDTGGGTEVDTDDWTDYAGVAVTNNDTNFPAATADGGGITTKANGVAISFGTATIVSNVTVTHFAIYDGATQLCWGELASPKIIQDGDPVEFPIGALTITLD